MLALAIESATDLAAVALVDETGVIGTVSLTRGRRHAEWIAPAAEFVCATAGVAVADLEGVCVDVGPGLFTGLRVGISFAKGLAFALGVPVTQATSLEILAHALCAAGAGGNDGALLVPVVDARRGEVFSARFELVPDASNDAALAQVGDDVRWAPEELARSLASTGRPVVLAGDGMARYSSTFEELGGAVRSSLFAAPPVEVLASIGLRRFGAGEGVEPSAVLPEYLRDADVRINWEQRLAPGERPAAVV